MKIFERAMKTNDISRLEIVSQSIKEIYMGERNLISIYIFFDKF